MSKDNKTLLYTAYQKSRGDPVTASMDLQARTALAQPGAPRLMARQDTLPKRVPLRLPPDELEEPEDTWVEIRSFSRRNSALSDSSEDIAPYNLPPIPRTVRSKVYEEPLDKRMYQSLPFLSMRITPC